MISAFGVEHGVSKGLKPEQMASLDRVARSNWSSQKHYDYARAKLAVRRGGNSPNVRTTGARSESPAQHKAVMDASVSGAWIRHKRRLP